MKRLELSTFCMASRRSSQLSYIRIRGSLAGIECFVHQRVGELIRLSPDVPVIDLVELPSEPRRLERKVAQRLIFPLVLPPHLLDEQLRVGDDLDLRHGKLEGLGETGD